MNAERRAQNAGVAALLLLLMASIAGCGDGRAGAVNALVGAGATVSATVTPDMVPERDAASPVAVEVTRIVRETAEPVSTPPNVVQAVEPVIVERVITQTLIVPQVMTQTVRTYVLIPNAEPWPQDRRGCAQNAAGVWECVP